MIHFFETNHKCLTEMPLGYTRPLYLEVEGKWYKISLWNFDVSETCQADDGFREATCEEIEMIEDVLND